jgi:beta-aspartyl-dipeptidase (metallo-type)
VDEGDPALGAAAAVGAWLDAGLPRERLTVSSDGGGCIPVFDGHGHVCRMDVGSAALLGATLKELLAAGRPLGEVLPCFTANVAALLRLGHKGRLAPGADADLCVLGADGGIEDVMARGRWLVRGGSALVRGRFEAPA